MAENYHSNVEHRGETTFTALLLLALKYKHKYNQVCF